MTPELASLNDIPAFEFPNDSISYMKTLKGPLMDHWKLARNKEIDDWMSQEVAEVAELPKRSTAILDHFGNICSNTST